MPHINHVARGYILAEVLVALGVLVLMTAGIFSAVVDGFEARRLGEEKTQALLLAQEGLEAARSIRDAGFANLSAGTFGLVLSGSRAHTADISGLTDGSFYNFYAKCRDSSGNTNSEDYPINFAVSPPAASVAAAYAFDEGVGLTAHDFSGNGGPGTLTNGPLWGAAGKYSNDLIFDGVNDYVFVPDSAANNISGNDLTLEFWMNTPGTGSIDYVMLSKPWNASSMTYPYYQYAVELDTNGGKTTDFYFGDTSGTLRGPFQMTPPLNAWTHVAYTYDGTSVKGYLDGVPKLNVPVSQNIQARGQSLRIGVDAAFGQPYKGQLDDVRIYNRALLQTEVEADMATPVSALAPPSLPLRSASYPAGLLPSGTVSATLSINTATNAECRYSPSPGTNFDDMTEKFFAAGQTWKFSGTSDATAPFTRALTLTPAGADRYDAVASVSWQFNPQRLENVTALTRFTNWK